MKKVVLGIPSGAAKGFIPLKLYNFRVASSYHCDELQITHYPLTGCQWSLVCLISNLLSSNFPRNPSHNYKQTCLETFLLIGEVSRKSILFL